MYLDLNFWQDLKQNASPLLGRTLTFTVQAATGPTSCSPALPYLASQVSPQEGCWRGCCRGVGRGACPCTWRELATCSPLRPRLNCALCRPGVPLGLSVGTWLSPISGFEELLVEFSDPADSGGLRE